MKLTQREKLLLGALVIVAVTVGFYVFWYMPVSERIDGLRAVISQKRQSIEDSKLRTSQYELLLRTRDAVLDEWGELIESVPERFDESEVLRCVDQILTPYTTGVAIVFPELPVSSEQSEIYPVTLRFTVPREVLLTVLQSFDEKALGLRVVSGTCVLADFETELMSVELIVEYLVRKTS